MAGRRGKKWIDLRYGLKVELTSPDAGVEVEGQPDLSLTTPSKQQPLLFLIPALWPPTPIRGFIFLLSAHYHVICQILLVFIF